MSRRYGGQNFEFNSGPILEKIEEDLREPDAAEESEEEVVRGLYEEDEDIAEDTEEED